MTRLQKKIDKVEKEAAAREVSNQNKW